MQHRVTLEKSTPNCYLPSATTNDQLLLFSRDILLLTSIFSGIWSCLYDD